MGSSKSLAKLLSQLQPKQDIQISGIQFDSRAVKPGDLFFAVPGFKEDGAKYIAMALKAGAAAVVCGRSTPADDNIFPVDDVRKALAETAANFYDRPAGNLFLVGATGTKGKTSSTYLLDAILQEAGRIPALLGTVECRHPGGSKYSERTTMESLPLQKFLREAVDHGAKSAVLEVSSHALSLHRVWGCKFAGVLFTNLQEDHLDFYSGMEDYFDAKKLLFTKDFLAPGAVAAVNVEDEYGARLAKGSAADLVTFGWKSGDVRPENVETHGKGLRFTVNAGALGKFPVESLMVGAFNVTNILGVVALALKLGIKPEHIQKAVAKTTVPGRLEQIPTNLPFSVFVDFAHMGAALENVLKSLKQFCQGKVILVFGAGGDRDPARRVQMGSVAAKYADFSFITSDNPRTEEPGKIIQAIEKSFISTKGLSADYIVEPDRRKAIRAALAHAKPGDIVCVAGKGHETGQIIGTDTFPFDDREECAKALRELEKP